MDVSISVQQLVSERDRGFGPQVLDVRRKAAFEAATHAIPGAVHVDPERIESWWRGLDLARPIVAYCSQGHEVSQGVSAFLREHGYPARYLEGGMRRGPLPANRPAGNPARHQFG